MELNEIGKIEKTHGLKGEVKVTSDSSFINERFKVGAKVYYKVKNDYKELIIKSHRSMMNYELVSFEGLDNIDLMVPYLGKTLYAEKNRDLLDEGDYFYSDYIGLNVVQFGKKVGLVKDIESYPHDDYLIISNGTDKTKMVPLRKEFIESVDLDKKELTIVDMEGLLYD